MTGNIKTFFFIALFFYAWFCLESIKYEQFESIKAEKFIKD